MRAGQKQYFLRVICVFVGLGPLIAGFPLVAVPVFLPALWIVGAIPAFLAALYYLVFTYWWFDAHAPNRRFYRTFLCGILGAMSGMLGIVSFFLLPVLQLSISKQLLYNESFSLILGVVGGIGSATIVAWKHVGAKESHQIDK